MAPVGEMFLNVGKADEFVTQVGSSQIQQSEQYRVLRLFED